MPDTAAPSTRTAEPFAPELLADFAGHFYPVYQGVGGDKGGDKGGRERTGG